MLKWRVEGQAEVAAPGSNCVEGLKLWSPSWRPTERRVGTFRAAPLTMLSSPPAMLSYLFIVKNELPSAIKFLMGKEEAFS